MKKTIGMWIVFFSFFLFNMNVSAESIQLNSEEMIICASPFVLLTEYYPVSATDSHLTFDADFADEILRQFSQDKSNTGYNARRITYCADCNRRCAVDGGGSSCIFQCERNELEHHLYEITEMNLSGRDYESSMSIARMIQLLPRLQRLILSDNNLSTFDVSPKYSQSLQVLDLRNNRLTEVEIWNDLRNLDLSSNLLTELNLKACGYLTDLKVNDNNLTSLDVSNCRKLETLKVDAKNFVTFAKFSSALKINNNHQIEGNELGTKVKAVKSLITVENSNVNSTYINKGQTLNDNDNITTGTILRTSLGNVASEYKFVILGDITGTGDVNVSDVARLYQYYKKKVDMESEFVQAGDVTKDGQIEINDVSKLYQYSKHKIDSLE